MILLSPQLVIKAGLSPFPDAAIAIDRGIVVATGHQAEIRKQYPRHRIVSFGDTVLLPGLVNLHTHLELPSLLPSIRTDRLPDWVLNLLEAKRRLNRDDYVATAAENIDWCIRTGTTTIAEICTHDVSPALLKNSGIRAHVFRELISMDPASPLPDLSALISRPSLLMHTGLSPHAPHTVSEKALREIRKFAVQKKIRVCMHVAESPDEIRLLQGKKSGFDKLYEKAGWDPAWAPHAQSPFAHLQKLGILNPRFLAVHAVQATEKDLQILKRTRVPVAHCPRSNNETAVGRMRLRKFLDAGIVVGLGTDSLASSPSLNMWDEMRYAYKIHRREGVSARAIFELATIGGAKALGMEHEIGTLDPGKRADIIAVPLPAKSTGDIYSDLLRETNSCIMTMVNGKILWTEK